MRESSFALWLRNRMDDRDLNQMDLARRMGINQGRVSAWLQGEVPRPATCQRIADALDVAVDVVLEAAGHRRLPVDEGSPAAQELRALFEALPGDEQTLVLEFARFRREQVRRRGA